MSFAAVRRLVVVAAVMLSALTVLVTSPTRVFAQFNEGDVVQADDGSLYVFEAGRLHPIQPVPATRDDIASALMGDPVTFGVTLIQPPVAAPPSDLRLIVQRVERQFRAPTPPASGREWVAVRVRIENNRDTTWSTGGFFVPERVFVVDSRGISSAAERAIVPDALEPNTAVAPGFAVEGTLLFSVPVGAQLQRVVWNDGSAPLMEAPIP